MCMCGDICCSSCGPAQGNSKCYACGEWESEGGCKDPWACDLKLLEMGYVDSIAEKVEFSYDNGPLAPNEVKKVKAYCIMRNKSYPSCIGA